MSSGSYDALHPSSTFVHGDSWRPPIRPNYYQRRRSPSPSRRYVSYDFFPPGENSYRPIYPEEDVNYYSRSPSPDHYSRAYGRLPEHDWERMPEQHSWASVPASWEEPSIDPVSPNSSTSKARRDSMLATRMFEPSDAWKHTHIDRPRIETTRALPLDRYPGEPLQPRTPNSYAPVTMNPYSVPNIYPIGGERYRQSSYHRDAYAYTPWGDSYRPPASPDRRWTPNMSPDGKSARSARASSSQNNIHTRKVSGTVSNVGSSSPRRSGRTRSRSRSRHSSNRDRRSRSRSLSRGRRRSSHSHERRSSSQRSLSRGRRSLSRGPTTASSSSPDKHTSSVKYSWDRPTAAASNAQTSLGKASTQPIQKNSWTRSDSRSSIASTHVSATTPPPQPQPAQPLHHEQKQVDATDVLMAPLPVTTTPIYKTVNTEKASIPKVDPPQNRVVHPVPPKPQLMVSQLKTKARSFQSPTLPKSSTRPAVDAEVNDVPKPIVVDQPPEERPPAHDIVSEKQAAPTISSLAPTTAVSATAVSLAEMTAVKERVVHTITFPAPILAPQPRPVETTTVALPTPLPTPQPRRTMGKPPSPPLPESIPTDAKSMREALRIVIMTRMLCDRQTREDRVEPVLRSNLSLEEPPADNRPSTTPQEVIDEVMQGPWHKARMETSDSMRGSLVERFRERQARLSEKVQQLREEYLSLHERWIAHCAQLDEQSKPPITESESASAAPSGRTTRRSTANNLLSDAVRSDLEMEQIIASLGNDDATDPNHLSLRNLATIPDMISVKRGRVDYTFDDTSHLVDDPKEYYGPHTGIHDWTDTEKEVFLDKFAAHPKQFGMIAEYLPNKTAAQCVDYYYLHKKRHIDFRKVILQYAPNKRKRRGTGKKKGNGLIADIRQHDAEVHGQQLDSPKTSGKRGRKPMHPPELKESRKLPLSRRRTYLDVTPSVGSATPTPEPESRRRGRRPAPVSRTVSVSLDDGEEDVADDSERPAKRAKRGRKVKSVAIINDNDEAGTPEPKLTEQTESISSWRKSGAMVTQWSEEDKSLFLTLLSQHGDDFKRIAASMPNKTTIQVSNYYKTNAEDLALEKIAACAPKRSLTPDARKEIPLPPTPSSSAANCVPPPGTAATPTPTRAPAPVCTPVPTPPPAPAPDPMASLAPDSPHLQPSGSTSSSSPHVYERQEGEMASMRWSYDRPTINTSPPNVRGYQYPRPSSGAYPVPHHHPLSPNGYGPPISYGYPPYHYAPPHPHHAQYDPMGMGAGSRLGSMSHQHPYPMHEPARRMGVEMEQGQRARENPYPVLPPPGLPYHYSLEP